MTLRNKVLLTILLAIGYWAIQQHFVSRDKAGGSDRVSQAQLLEWYTNDNKDYFEDKLTHNVEIVWVNLRYKDAMGDTDCNAQGCRIRLDSYTNVAPVTAHLSLDHEMCHVATQGEELNHGPKFRNCVTMLFIKGALDGLI